MIGALLSWPLALFWWLAAWFGAAALLTYVVPFTLAHYALAPQDLRAKYGARWAMVTGASSGIGLAIAHRLAKQVRADVARRCTAARRC